MAAPRGAAHRGRDARRGQPPDKILAVPDENLVGSVRDDKHLPWRRAVTPPSPTANNAGRSTTVSIRQGIAPTRNRRRSRLRDRLQPATRSTLLGHVGPTTRRFLPAAETCGPPVRAVAPRSRSRYDACVMQQNASLPGPAGRDRSLDICSIMQHVTRGGPRIRAPTDGTAGRGPPARERACSYGAHEGLCADTHTRVRRRVRAAARSASHVFSGRSPHEPSSSGQPSVDRLRDHLLTCARCWPLAKRRLVRTSS